MTRIENRPTRWPGDDRSLFLRCAPWRVLRLDRLRREANRSSLLNLFSTIESGGGTRCALSFRKEKKPTFFALIRTWVHRFPSRTAKLSRLRPGQYVGERSQRNPGWREVYYDTHLFFERGVGFSFYRTSYGLVSL